MTTEIVVNPSGGGSGSVTLAGDVTGAGGANVVVNLKGAAGVVTVTAATTINFGTNPSTTGLINLPNNVSISQRNAGNTADVNIAKVDASTTLTLGDATNAAVVIVGSNGNLALRGSQMLFQNANGTFSNSFSMSTGSFAMDATAATPVWSQAAASGNGKTWALNAQSSNGANGNGGLLQLTGGDLNGSGLPGGVQLCAGAASPEAMVEVAEVVLGNTIVALARGAAITSTQMPANTGDGVIYLANAVANPSANSVSGSILYVTAGATTVRGTSSTVTTIAPA